MLIRITEKVTWDTGAMRQSEEALTWYRENVLPQLEQSEPVVDQYGRPKFWRIETDGVTVMRERIYIAESTSWALKEDKITIKPV